MSLRFRRTMKIAPGLRLNATKRGLSISAGVRGARVTWGTSGTRATAGIPGSGIFYSEKLGTTPNGIPKEELEDGVNVSVSSSTELREYIQSEFVIRNPTTGRRYTKAQLEGMLKRLERREEFEQNQSQVEIEEQAYQARVNIHLEALPIPEESHWQERLEQIPFEPDKFLQVPPEKSEIDFKVSKRIYEENKLPAFDWTLFPASASAIFAAGLLFNKYHSYAIAMALLAIGFAILFMVRIHKCRKSKRNQLKASIAIECNEIFQNQQSEWEKAQKAHSEKIEILRKEHLNVENLRIEILKRVIAGDIAAIEQTLNEELNGIDVPFETEISIEVPTSNCIYLDVDLPEIEDCISPITKNVLKSGKIKEKNKSRKIQNEEYGRLTTGFAFYLASLVYNHCPTVQNVVVSGYTQRIEKSTGQITDQYIYSAVINKTAFSKIKFKEVDPIRAMDNFNVKWKISASYVLSPIVPYSLSEIDQICGTVND